MLFNPHAMSDCYENFEEEEEEEGGGEEENEEENEEPTAEELAAQLKEIKEEKEKLKAKDYNFRKIEEDKNAAIEKAKGKETAMQTLKREQEEWREKQETDNKAWKEAQFSEQKEQYFKGLCGEDQELRGKIETEMEMIKGDTNTAGDLKNKMEKAYLIVQGSRPEPSAFGSLGTTSGPHKPSKKSFSDSDKGTAVLNKVAKGKIDWDKQPKHKEGDSYFNN